MNSEGKKPFRTNPIGEGLNLYRHDGWKGQLKRLRRWHERIHRLLGAEVDANDVDAYVLDYAYVFFQNCAHLGDWVIHDRPDMKGAVKRLFDKSPELRVARDISNATKHFGLNRRPWVTGGFADGREYAPHERRGESYFVISGGKMYRMFDLIDRCMDTWERFAKAER